MPAPLNVPSLRLSRTFRERFSVPVAELPEDLTAIRRMLAPLEQAHQAHSLDPLHAGQLQATWLINTALAIVIQRYCERVDRDALRRALDRMDEAIGREAVDGMLAAYAEAFDHPPFTSPDERLNGLQRLLLTWLANVNPAMKGMRELWDDEPLRAGSHYERLIGTLGLYFQERPPFGPENQALVAMLRAPAIAVPDSLRGQLAYMRERWAYLLEDLLDRLLMAMDVLAEEERAIWLRMHPLADPAAGAAAAASVYDFRSFEGEVEAFTQDHEWHPRVVLMAKNAHVWLDQLARRYQREIHRLDQIPDEELDRLGGAGITGLWLIGIWQRSRASERIKRMRGNPEAAASAYALENYRVADELGGEDAWANLSERAWRRGVRLASDMVPNHMGVDSRWVMDHPEWFLSLNDPPYPGYSFNGPDLSDDSRAAIFLEDHYWDDSDAAVVFKRVDRGSGETRYIYHGNDGTSFPWNDTAQLDYIRAEVREQVIQTILSVARRFPIIRFDAAMVLAKRHIRRLWWPEPGSGGGAIPSRAEHAMPAAEFDRLMPQEFWREVVDRVKAEGLETLLLAEAFWLLEGYFVRTLGMHRVYNSAFMHMLRDERNAEYRLVMKNTLEFDPEVLKRYVNFMNNPDEKPAVEQFGKGDKYFGVCTLLSTLPGLPMFGHGQIEGFGEKYGMEYRRAYWEEPIDQELVARHEREIFPLLRRRAEFAEVNNFLLYDFMADGGWVNEDVFAYTNGHGGRRSLVVYHNRFGSTSGAVRDSVAYSRPDGLGGRQLVRRSLAHGLGLPEDDADLFVTFREHLSGLEYIRPARELRERGLWLALGAYGRQVFLDFAQVRDGASGLWRRVCDHLDGRGTASLSALLDELLLEPLRAPFGRLVNAGTVRRLVEDEPSEVLAGISPDLEAFAAGVASSTGATVDLDPTLEHLRQLAELAHRPVAVVETGHGESSSPASQVTSALPPVATALALTVLGPEGQRRLDEWRLGPIVAAMFRDLGADEGAAWRRVEGVRALASLPPWPDKPSADAVLRAWLADEAARRAIGVNVHGGVEWIRAEDFEAFVESAVVAQQVRGSAGELETLATDLKQRLVEAGYRADKLLPSQQAQPERRRQVEEVQAPNTVPSE
ncbi:MAG: alpha-amylase [Chloroflexi bacterium]|nr:alpha-amylase [Chloroflexota bacterium]